MMYAYLRTDIRRLLRRFPRWLMLFLSLGALSLMVSVMGQTGLYGRWNAITYMAAIKTWIKPLPLLIGLIEIIFIFGDDLKAKTMQAAIGTGLSRAGLVGCKLIETALFALFDVILYGLLTLLIGVVFQAALLGSQLGELAVYLLVAWLKVLGYTSITMILLFFTRSLGLSLVFYIALFTKIVHNAVSVLLSFGPMEKLHVERYTLTSYLDILQTYLTGGSGLGPLLIVLGYIAAGCLAAMLLFQKRELEF